MNEMQIEAEKFAKKASQVIIAYYEGDDDVSKQDINQDNEELQEKYQDVLDYRDKLMDKYNGESRK